MIMSVVAITGIFLLLYLALGSSRLALLVMANLPLAPRKLLASAAMAVELDVVNADQAPAPGQLCAQGRAMSH